MNVPFAEREPMVSVVMPVYNCERYLAEAIDSALAQTYRPLEIIVVDDGSTDGSAEVAARYASPVRYCYQSNVGIGSARNRGLELAQGSFFSFLDADDLWLEDKTALQMAAFDENPNLDMVFGQAIQFHSPELEPTVSQVVRRTDGIMPGCVPGAFLIRRRAFFRVGLFATEWQVGEWADWYLRATEYGLKSHMLPQVVLKRRLHDANIGIRERNSQTDYVRILKASLDRRRRASANKGSA